tara:strand:+ start:588 stop:701 length:114 start_codon:yes stop_codon:yes gene_type:complete
MEDSSSFGGFGKLKNSFHAILDFGLSTAQIVTKIDAK